MTLRDFEDRWLTLGTESKIGSAQLSPPPSDPNQPPRRIQGEKGMAGWPLRSWVRRCSCYPGHGLGGNRQTARCSVFTLETFRVAVPESGRHQHSDQGVRGRNAADKSRRYGNGVEAATSLEQLALSSGGDRAEQIRKEMDAFSLDPQACAESLGDPSLDGSGCGTHFYIVPVDTIIDDDIDSRRSRNAATRLEKT